VTVLFWKTSFKKKKKKKFGKRRQVFFHIGQIKSCRQFEKIVFCFSEKKQTKQAKIK